MENNIFDLEDYSNDNANDEILEESKNNSSQKNISFQTSSKSISSEKEEFTPPKIQINPEEIKDFSNNNTYMKSSNPINIPSIFNKKNYNYEQIQNSQHKMVSYNSEENEKKSLNEYAIEDNISVFKFDELKEPAMKFPFKLDDFQKRSILRLEQKKNILVCAHTSSGKTLVAEYGIALGKKNCKKVIYTSPIKALSNQKYCEFKKKFDDVGIITGDVNINPNAQCLIITTEILHKFLYNQSNSLNKVGTVIFDEVHYINDNERGHIWEEILIVLPSYISIIMLSATIPNYYEFACWVGKIKNTIVYVEITKNRVVPLQHFIYIDKNNIFKVKDKDEKIDNIQIENAFKYIKQIKASKNNFKNNLNLNIKLNNNDEIKNDNDNIIKDETLNSSSNEDIEEIEGNELNDDETNNEEENNEISDNDIKERHIRKNAKKKILEMAKYLLNNNLFPATLFVFNIRRIKDFSTMLIKNNNLPELSIEEKERVNNFFNKAISSIPIQEQNITQINYIKEILQ